MLRERRILSKKIDGHDYSIIFVNGSSTKIMFSAPNWPHIEITPAQLGNILSLLISLSTPDYDEVCDAIKAESGVEIIGLLRTNKEPNDAQQD